MPVCVGDQFFTSIALRWRRHCRRAMTAARGNQDREIGRMLEGRDQQAVMAPDAQAWTSEAAWSLYQLPFNDLLFGGANCSPPAFRS
jgi:hypothetical protein